MAKQTFVFFVRAVVSVDVDDSLVPDDDWRKQFYQSVKTLKDVASMIAYNAAANGTEKLNQLDGFADRDNSLAEVRLDWDSPEEA